MRNRPMPWDEDRLRAVEREANACPSGDACSQDVVSLVAEVRRLRTALLPFAHHALGGWDTRSTRRYSIRVTEGQVARAAKALLIGFDPDPVTPDP